MSYTERMLEMQFYNHSISQMASTMNADKINIEGDLVTVAIPSLDNNGLILVREPGELERGPRGPGPE